MEELVMFIGTFDDMINKLIEIRESGGSAFCDFLGHRFYSDTISFDSAYIELFGCGVEEFRRRQQVDFRESISVRESKRKDREAMYAHLVEASRAQGEVTVSVSNVIDGLKFIAENQSMSHVDLVVGLLGLGCNFSFDDIKKHGSLDDISLFEGMKQGNICVGAAVVANVRDNELYRDYVFDRFLELDDESSIYHFVRLVTGDSDYTKRYVDSLNRGKRKQLS